MEERLKLMLEWSDVETSVSELCRCYGVSRKTAYKWRERYLADGVPGLSDRSRAPRCHPRAMSAEVVTAVLGVRHTHPTWGPKKIRAYLERHRPGMGWPAVSSIGDLLRREGLVVIRRKRLRAPPRTAPFADCVAANDVWCIDLKGWFRCGDGARCDPLTLADAASRYLLRCQALRRTDGEARLAGSGGGVPGVWPALRAALGQRSTVCVGWGRVACLRSR